MSAQALPSLELLTRLAGSAAFQRGMDYAGQGLVRIDIAAPDSVTALAHGTREYRLQLRWNSHDLDGECDCPVGLRGGFCKHQVAAALLWIAGGTTETQELDEAPTPPGLGQQSRTHAATPRALVEAWLERQSVEQLCALLMSIAARHVEVSRELVAHARLASATPADHRKAVSELIGRKRFLDYHATIAYADRLQALTSLLRERLPVDPAQTLELAGYALTRLFALYEAGDDSSGALGQVLRDVADLHRRAAQHFEDLDGFASTWLKLKLVDDWDLVDDVNAYAATLGKRGIAWLETQVSARLDALPSGGERWEHAGQRLGLLSLLEQIAHHGGDVDAMLARRERASLDHAMDYLDLHQLCVEHGRPRIAEQWLERGIKAFPHDTRLIAVLGQARHAAGFADEALQLGWRAFELAPGAVHFLQLREFAGAVDWPHWRLRALELARRPARGADTGEDLVVRLHLAEGDIEAIVALLPGARLSPQLWSDLVTALSPGHPQLALMAAGTLAEAAIKRTNKGGYREAVAWLKRMRTLHDRLDDGAGFDRYLAGLSARHKAKRSFVEMLERAFPAR